MIGAIFNPASGRIIHNITASERSLEGLNFVEGARESEHYIADGGAVAKTVSPLLDSYSYSIGGPDLALPCSPDSRVKDIDEDGDSLGVSVEDGPNIERAYIVTGVYQLVIDDPRYFKKTVEIVVTG